MNREERNKRRLSRVETMESRTCDVEHPASSWEFGVACELPRGHSGQHKVTYVWEAA